MAPPRRTTGHRDADVAVRKRSPMPAASSGAAAALSVAATASARMGDTKWQGGAVRGRWRRLRVPLVVVMADALRRTTHWSHIVSQGR